MGVQENTPIQDVVSGAEDFSAPESLSESGSGVALPSWLTECESYEPPKDRDAFVGKSMLSLMAVLEHFRLDDGRALPISPSAPMKLIIGLASILLVSLSKNFAFTFVMLALVVVRLALMPPKALKRTLSVSLIAALATALIMVPAVFLGQPQSAIRLSVKVFISVSIALCVALSTPFNQLTGAFRVFHVPDIFILTIDLALKSIVQLGETALEILTALKLRSVGKNKEKGRSLGGVAGVTFLKAQAASEESYEAMRCRGFEGEYIRPAERAWKPIDLVWLVALVAIIVLFFFLESLV